MEGFQKPPRFALDSAHPSLERSARLLPERLYSFFFRSEDKMLGAYLMALFAMLFAASTALTLIHFVSRLDSPAPDIPAESPSEHPAAA